MALATSGRPGALTRGLAFGCAALLALAACSSPPAGQPVTPRTTVPGGSSAPAGSAAPTTATAGPVRRPQVYAAAASRKLSAVARQARPLVYVPNSVSNTVDEIDPTTLKVVRSFPVGREPQHVVPSYDLRTLWVNDDLGNDLVPIDPVTGLPGRAVPVDDPYNLYFTPDGRHALVMAERLRRIDVRNPHTMRLERSLPVPCRGVNHADVTADGTRLLVSCEYSGKLLVLASDASRVERVIDLNGRRTPGQPDAATIAGMGGPVRLIDPKASAMPQDVRLVGDGSVFLVADMLRGGVWRVDAATTVVLGFLPTGLGAHGVYPSRDASRIYVSNRDEGTVSVLDAKGTRVLTTWHLGRNASPDMGGVSADGLRLWLSGRYSGVVYVLDTATGRLIRSIKVGAGPHGLAVWPQPGRFSLGHTGNMR